MTGQGGGVFVLAVRQFRCQAAPQCARRTFVEQVDEVTERFARRTSSLCRTLERIALALAGRPAARRARHLSIPASAMCAEIREQGYLGSERTVRCHLQDVRTSGKPAPAKPDELTLRKATWLLTAHPDKIDDNNALKLKQILARCPNWMPLPTAYAPSPGR